MTSTISPIQQQHDDYCRTNGKETYAELVRQLKAVELASALGGDDGWLFLQRYCAGDESAVQQVIEFSTTSEEKHESHARQAVVAHEISVERTLRELRGFLSTPNHGNASWPELSVGELTEATRLLRQVCVLKWASDCDGDSPVHLRLWSRAKFRPVCDFAYIKNSPSRDETDGELEERCVANLHTLALASASCAEEIRRVHLELAEIQETKRRRRASFTVYVNEYQGADDAYNGRRLSIHLTQEAAESFAKEQALSGVQFRRGKPMMALPGWNVQPKDDFSAYRQKVNSMCEQLFPSDAGVVYELNLQHST